MRIHGTSAAATIARGGEPPAHEPVANAPPVTVIVPQSSWLDWRLRELWRSRDLILLFVWRDFVAVYKQTILGPVWHLVRPVLTTFVFTVVFSRMAGLSTDGAPPFLFYMAGLILWTYFATCLDTTSKMFVSNLELLGKVYFHRLVIPVSLAISNLIAFGIQLCLLIILHLMYRPADASLQVTGWVLSIPLLLIIVAGYALGAGVIVCALTTRYRDLVYLVTFGVQLLMYLTPVIYPVSAVPERYRWLAQLNPLTPLIEAFRRGLLGVGTVTADQVVICGLGMVLVLIAALMLFSRVERTFLDTV